MAEPAPTPQWTWINSNWELNRAGRLFDSTTSNLVIESDGEFLYLSQEHARLIVRAVNCHDDLVQCLAVIMEHLDSLEGDEEMTELEARGALASKNWHWFNHARATLAKARGQTGD